MKALECVCDYAIYALLFMVGAFVGYCVVMFMYGFLFKPDYEK